MVNQGAKCRSNTVTLVIVARNEEVGLRPLLPAFRSMCSDRCLAIDGNSTDATAELLIAEKIPVYHQKQRGLEHAMLEARAYVRTP